MLFTYDIGHGKNTAGKRSPDGEREWYFNKTYSDAFVNRLKMYNNVTVKCVSDITGNVDTPLSTRTNIANANGSKCHISFHCNANTSQWGTWGGVETHVYKKCSTTSESYKLASVVQTALVNSSGLRNRGVKLTDLHMTRETNMTAILIENGFMDSTIDIKVLRSATKMKLIGTAIADAVAKFYKLTLKSGATNPTQQVVGSYGDYVVPSTHVGVATNTAQISLYSEANIKTYKGKLQAGSWKMYAEKNGLYNIGNGWIQGASMTNLVTFKRRILTIKGTAVKCYKQPNTLSSNYLKTLSANTSWKVYAFSNDKKYVLISESCWVKYNPNYMALS